MLSLIDRAINAFNAKTEHGAVNDTLPFAAVYGLLDALQHGSTTGIRAEDVSRFRRLMGGSEKVARNEIEIADNKMTELSLVEAKTTTAGGRNRQTIISGRLELTDTGRRWAVRLNELCGEPMEPAPNLVDCGDCGCLHRDDVSCPW